MKRTLLGILGLGLLLGAWVLAQPLTNSITAQVTQQLQFVLTSSNLTVRGGGYTLTLGPVDEAALVRRVIAQLTNSVIEVRGTNLSFTLTPKL